MVPADFLRSVGFKTVRPHPRWPRLRMELRSAMTWKEDVEAALEQLLGTITVPLQSTESATWPAVRYGPGSDGPQRRSQGAPRRPLPGDQAWVGVDRV